MKLVLLAAVLVVAALVGLWLTGDVAQASCLFNPPGLYKCWPSGPPFQYPAWP